MVRMTVHSKTDSSGELLLTDGTQHKRPLQHDTPRDTVRIDLHCFQASSGCNFDDRVLNPNNKRSSQDTMTKTRLRASHIDENTGR